MRWTSNLLSSVIISASVVLVTMQITFEDWPPSCTNNALTCVTVLRCSDPNAIRNQICGFEEDIPLVCCLAVRNPPNNFPIPSTTEDLPTPTVSVVPEPTVSVVPEPTVSVVPEPTVSVVPEPAVSVVPELTVSDVPEPSQSPGRSSPGRKSTLPTDCGKPPSIFFNRIIGGEKVQASSWPWLVLLYIDGEAECGASIISEQWLITASHCVYEDSTAKSLLSPSRLKIRKGVTDLSQPSTFYSVSKVIPHPDYLGAKNYANDIALVKLEKKVRFTRTLTAICLPGSPGDAGDPTQQDSSGRMAFIAGWGKTNQDDRRGSDVLLQAQVPVWSKNNCMQVYRKIFPITSTSFCAGPKDGSKDACQGDSGGPLMLPGLNEFQDRFYCVGVVSFGYGCGRPGYPGGYTNVSLYRRWIEEQILI